MKTIWRKKDLNEEIFNIVEEKYKKNKLISTLVSNRIDKKEDIEQFLNPKIEDLHSPFDLPDMEKAVERIISAIEKKENVLIYGDYDADGMTSTTVLFKYLKERDLNPKYYIPNKIDEGYGFNIDAIDSIIKKYKKEEKIDLIITVDCGISSIEEVDYANKNGIDVIITDHHEPQEKLPNAIAVVDPKIKSDKVKFQELAGVGVVFKLIIALSEKLNLPTESYCKFIDFVAMGTIADIVPLLSENRIITKYGLERFKDSENPVIKFLYNENKDSFNETTISFNIAPRINASGRLGREDVAMKFLLSETYEDASRYYMELEEINNERRNLSDDIYEEAVLKIKEKGLDKNPIIIIGDEKWHSGVTGIVAAKLVDLFRRPTIVFSIEGELAQGSGRTTPEINIYELLTNASDIIEEFGGHEKAAGITLKADKLDELKKILEKEIESKDFSIIEEYDFELGFENINYNILKDIDELAPFGEKNLKPDFLFKRVEVTSVNVYGNMLKLGLRQNNLNFVGIGFGLAHKQENLKTKLFTGDHVFIIGKLEENVYMNRSSIQVYIKEYNLLKNKI